MAKTKKMAFGGMGNMPSQSQMQARGNAAMASRGGAPQRGIQTQAMPGGGLGRGMAPPSQMLQASGPTGYVGPQSGGFGPMSTATTNPSQMGMLPNANPGGMAPMGPGTQTGGPAPMGMAPPNAAQVGAFKKGGAVKAKAFAKGGAIIATKMGKVKTATPTMRSASSRADGIAVRGKTRA